MTEPVNQLTLEEYRSLKTDFNSEEELTVLFDALLDRLAPHLQKPDCEYHFSRVAIGDAPHPPARPHLHKRLAVAGLRDWRFDRTWPDERVAIEVDGGQRKPGGGRHNRDSDRDKLNAAAALGWRVLRFSGEMLNEDPIRCIDVLRKALMYEWLVFCD